jgi:hypothetical protein
VKSVTHARSPVGSMSTCPAEKPPCQAACTTVTPPSSSTRKTPSEPSSCGESPTFPSGVKAMKPEATEARPMRNSPPREVSVPSDVSVKSS